MRGMLGINMNEYDWKDFMIGKDWICIKLVVIRWYRIKDGNEWY
jgi:hypothetical protein